MNDNKARIERLRNRTKRGAKNRGKTGLGTKTVLDYSKANPLSLKEDRPIPFIFSAEKGKKRLIDSLPFVVSQNWYKDMKEKSGDKIGTPVGDWDYKLEYPIHNTKNGPMLCVNLAFGRDCLFCNTLYTEWKKDKADQDEDKIKAMKTSWRCSYNIYDYDGSGEIELWDFQSYVNFEELLLEEVDCDDDGLAIFWELSQGKSIEYDTREKELGGNKYHVAKSISFVDRDPYDESILEKVHSLDAMLIIPTDEEIKQAFLQVIAGDEEEQANNEQSTEQPKTNIRQRPGSRQIKVDEPKQLLEECFVGRTWGADNDPDNDDCAKCPEDAFQACGLEFNRLNSMANDEPEVKAEIKPENEKPVKRRRRQR